MKLNTAEAIGHLRTARNIVEDNEMGYICHALRMSVGVPLDRDVTGNATVDALLKYIRTELGKWREPCIGEGVMGPAVATNLREAGHEDLARQLNNGYCCILMRLAWIDRMIFELETEGKLP